MVGTGRLRSACQRVVVIASVAIPALFGLGAVTCSPAFAADLIFFNGFESGTLCAWGGACPPPATVDGPWRFTLDFSGQPRELVVLLHQRAAGDLVGYMLGGTPKRLVTGGTYSSGTLTLDLLFERPTGDRALHLVATVAGDHATGTVTGDLGSQALSMFRWPEPLEERRWIVADLDFPPGFGTITTAHLAVVLRANGEFVTGGYAAAEMAGCLWDCDGGISSFSQAGPAVTFGLETEGGCSAGSTATLSSASVHPETGLWLGSTTFTDCAGTVSGPILGGPSTATRSDDAAEVLAAVAGVADQLQAGSPFAAPHPSFADNFFHEGRNLAATLAALNAEIAAWDNIEVRLSRVRRISTLALSGVPPILFRPHGIEAEESRSGVPIGGGARVLYLDPARNPFDDIHDNPLSVADLTPSGWRLGGDHQTAFDLPLLTQPVGPADTTLHVSTPGGTVYVSLGPYGSHFSPLTGHVYGDGKPNLAGFLIAGESELAELIGDGSGDDDGICETGEACAYWGGLDGSLVRGRVPTFVASHDAKIESIVFHSAPTGVYFDNPPQWLISMRSPANVESALDHVGGFSAGLADAVAVATGCDPRNWISCGLSPGDDLLSGLPPILVSAGSTLAQPQVFATAVAGYPGYYVGGGTFLEFPWAQIEFRSHVPNELKAEACPYLLYSDARRAELRGVMERDMLDPASLRYRNRSIQPRWKWATEATLCTAHHRPPGRLSIAADPPRRLVRTLERRHRRG